MPEPAKPGPAGNQVLPLKRRTQFVRRNQDTMCNPSGNSLDHALSYPDEKRDPAEDGRNLGLPHLSLRQRLVLPTLAIAPAMTEAARQAGVSRSSLHRWLQNENFRNELHERTAEAAELTRHELESLTRKSCNTLTQLMEDPDPVVRLRAARTVAVLGVQVSNLSA